jgi:hypothetical protein
MNGGKESKKLGSDSSFEITNNFLLKFLNPSLLK